MPSAKHAIFDAHCDTLDKLRHGGTLCDASLQFNLPQANRYARYVQVMAIWIDMESGESPYIFAKNGIRQFQKQKCEFPLFCTAHALRSHEKGPGFILAVEGGESIEGRIENLRTLFQNGVRLMTLTWNHVNEIADTAASPCTPGGLTPFGKSVVREMEALGMAVDVSHISEKGFWDVVELAEKPIIASHSCAKKLCAHHRNLTDAQFGAICDSGGVVGINFYPLFLGDDKTETILRHIFHFLDRGGENHIGFGSDFDGISVLPREIRGAGDVYKIINLLLKKNLPEKTVRKIAYENMESYFLRVLPEKN